MIDNEIKYYYDDALKAAWMRREFGVRFCNKGGLGLLPLAYTYSLLSVISQLNKVIQSGDKIYINPDDNHIFDPRNGDDVLISFNCDIRGASTAIVRFDDIGGHWGDAEIEGIEKRNNTAFFMPELVKE